MARKSRKNLPAVAEVKTYHAAIYARLSFETEANRERDTIDTQIACLKNFIDGQEDMELAGIYADVSASGTNFERPEFGRMMEDIRAGKIDTVITKDLSRLGRNYIDSGTYIERIFPLFHVRYIAVNDDFDTGRGETDLTMPLKNIINEWYSRDLSGKMHASYRAMWKNGEYIYGRPPYGYKKDAVAKKLVVDGQAAPVVKRIFGMYLGGMTYSEIARELQREGIVSPPRYRYLEQGNMEKAEKAKDWYHLHIKTILTNRHYAGDSVHATREGGFNNPKKDRRVSEEKWLIIPDTHKPLVSREIFDEVQEKIKTKVKSLHARNAALEHEKTPENFFTGRCVCACCRKNIGVVRSNSGSNFFYYRCTTTPSGRNVRCTAHGKIKYQRLHDAVFQVIKSHMKLCLEKTGQTRERNRSSHGIRKYGFYAGEAARIQNNIHKIKSRERGLYEDYKDGLITSEEYLRYQKNYRGQAAELEKLLQEMMEKQKHYNKDFLPDKDWAAAVKKYMGKRKLTKEMADAFVEKIVLDKEGNVEVTLKYDDFLKELVQIAEEEGGVV
ncbi:MAG: recombinase family protein [Clostridium sp.]|nr:recombinase family protein [Clostridium sp.]